MVKSTVLPVKSFLGGQVPLFIGKIQPLPGLSLAGPAAPSAPAAPKPPTRLATRRKPRWAARRSRHVAQGRWGTSRSGKRQANAQKLARFTKENWAVPWFSDEKDYLYGKKLLN